MIEGIPTGPRVSRLFRPGTPNCQKLEALFGELMPTVLAELRRTIGIWRESAPDRKPDLPAPTPAQRRAIRGQLAKLIGATNLVLRHLSSRGDDAIARRVLVELRQFTVQRQVILQLTVSPGPRRDKDRFALMYATAVALEDAGIALSRTVDGKLGRTIGLVFEEVLQRRVGSDLKRELKRVLARVAYDRARFASGGSSATDK